MSMKKNSVILLLITFSVAFILLLQVFWIRGAYKNEVIDLRRQSNSIFKNTVSQLRDTLFFSSVVPAMDSAVRIMSNVNIRMSSQSLKDTVHIGKNHMQVFIRAIDDTSLVDLLNPITKKLWEARNSKKNFSIRIAADSINLDTLTKHYARGLAEAGITSKTSVSEVKFKSVFDKIPPPMSPHFVDPDEYFIAFPPQSLFSDTLRIEPIRLNPSKMYAAQLFGMRLTILKMIQPQILFSIFIMVLITVSFVVMYRNIKSQQRLMEIKNDFISNVTHELKTPVTTVSVALEALRNFKGLENPQRTEEYLDIAQSELNRLTILTDKILKTATFESKGIHFEAEPVDLLKTLEQVLLSMKLVFEKQKAKVSFEKMGDSFVIHGGLVHLTNVIYNLLDNALKYSEGEPTISISLNADSQNVILKVADKGIGIPKEYTKKIFEKFFRVPAGDVHNVKGYGLGLSYVESVIKSHKGNIEVESEKGKGSTFTISLPKLATS
jgi:two-component system, OmpR family, phosphate regulon sensor histidine kinase PhoR